MRVVRYRNNAFSVLLLIVHLHVVAALSSVQCTIVNCCSVSLWVLITELIDLYHCQCIVQSCNGLCQQVTVLHCERYCGCLCGIRNVIPFFHLLKWWLRFLTVFFCLQSVCRGVVPVTPAGSVAPTTSTKCFRPCLPLCALLLLPTSLPHLSLGSVKSQDQECANSRENVCDTHTHNMVVVYNIRWFGLFFYYAYIHVCKR